MALEDKEKLETTFQPVKISSTTQTNGEPIAPFPHGDVQASYYSLKPKLQAEMFPFCVQVERALCASVFPVCYPACQKNSRGDKRGETLWRVASHSVFLFCFYFSKRCFVSLKRMCFSTPFQCADIPTVRC